MSDMAGIAAGERLAFCEDGFYRPEPFHARTRGRSRATFRDFDCVDAFHLSGRHAQAEIYRREFRCNTTARISLCGPANLVS